MVTYDNDNDNDNHNDNDNDNDNHSNLFTWRVMRPPEGW